LPPGAPSQPSNQSLTFNSPVCFTGIVCSVAVDPPLHRSAHSCYDSFPTPLTTSALLPSSPCLAFLPLCLPSLYYSQPPSVLPRFSSGRALFLASSLFAHPLCSSSTSSPPSPFTAATLQDLQDRVACLQGSAVVVAIMPVTKPKLEKLSTPVTATFPSEIASASTATPLSAINFPCKPDPDFIKTPISPPSAYTDFLTKAMSLNSPIVASSGETTPDSASGAAPSEKSEGSSKAGDSSPSSTASSTKPSPPTSAPVVPPSPYTSSGPMSAPPTGAASFPSLKLPPSPAISNFDSPLSASTVRSPFSARSVHSVFDWKAALKARFADSKKHKSSRPSVRHIREVVTRTVTYTPRMEPAPRGKRRKVE